MSFVKNTIFEVTYIVKNIKLNTETECTMFIEAGSIEQAKLHMFEAIENDTYKLMAWKITEKTLWKKKAVRSNTLWEEYKKYQTEWMINHGYTVRDLIESLIEFDREWGEDVSFQTLYNTWLKDSGFGGEIWACFDEWKETEGEGKIFINVEEDN